MTRLLLMAKVITLWQITSMNILDLKTSGEAFLQDLTAELEQQGLPTQTLFCDHLCFRVNSQHEYDSYKAFLQKEAQLLTEANVNGRPICTFKLASPFKTPHHEVYLLELPAPKPSSPYATGFEHAEFVINESFDQFKSRYSHLSFKLEGNKSLNPELCLKLENKQVKFHHHALDRIIEIEEASVKHIIFDFDGTLIKSREIIHEINRIVFSKALDREIPLQESIDKFHPEFSKLFEAFEVTCADKKHEAITSWGTVSDQFSYDLFDGALETLTTLKAQGYHLHLWTARDEYSARKILKQHQIEEFFTTLSFANATHSKPHSNSLLFDWKSSQKDQVIVIGDSSTDILGAKNISAIRAAALWDPFSSKSSLEAAGAELFFHDFSDLTNWFEK